MPMTLPTHPLAVVPLKLWRPHWFDGVALVIGAMAPDFAYAEDGYGLTIHSHAWHAPLWWALPVTLIAARSAVRRRRSPCTCPPAARSRCATVAFSPRCALRGRNLFA